MATGDPNPTGFRRGRGPDEALGCGWAWLWFWLFVVLIILSGWGWWGWYGGWAGPWGWWAPRPIPPTQTTPQTAPQQPTGPSEFLGRSVTLSGRVEQVFGPQVFTLAGTDGGSQLLVVAKNNKAPTVQKGDTVHVEGTVVRYNAEKLHQTTGADLGKVAPREFSGEEALVASSVSTRVPPGE